MENLVNFILLKSQSNVLFVIRLSLKRVTVYLAKAPYGARVLVAVGCIVVVLACLCHARFSLSE